MFQSTLPHGERPIIPSPVLVLPSFNPRSRMGSDFTLILILVVSVCFNPRSRMGSDQGLTLAGAYGDVSIHAPAWGATNISKW